MESYHRDRKRDKFDYAITGIFICSIIVSFNHTIALYESAGFDVPIGWMNNHWTEQWFGKGFFNLALFATLAAEAAFSVGLWGLYEAFRMDRRFPGWKYKFTWGMFIGGLVVIGWSNIGGTLGYNYLFGNPVKGFVLGLSIPYFVLNAVLVNFSRSLPNELNEQPKQPEQPKLTLWAASLANAVNTFREITKTEHEHKQIEHEQHYEQPKAGQTNREHEHEHEHAQTPVHKQPEHEQNKWSEHERTEHEHKPEHEQPEHEQFKQNDEQTDREQTEQRKQIEREQRKRQLYIVNGNGRGQSKVEQAVQCALKLMERNEHFTVRELARMAGCSPATAQNALNRLKERKQA